MSSKNVCRLLAAFAAFLLFPVLAPAQTQPWTGAGPTAVIDEQSVGIYADQPQYLGYLPGLGSTGDIIGYFNVTDTTATVNPAWSTLQLGYFDSSPSSQVKASLVQLNSCNGSLKVLCTVTSVDSTAITCGTCTFPAGSVNFAANTYYVQVVISRSDPAQAPKLFGVRVF
jgi:hypothetical protein